MDADDTMCPVFAADAEALAGLQADLCSDTGRLVVGLGPDLVDGHASLCATRAGQLVQFLLCREGL